MKILNFTAKEILPALLDRSKRQTMRPAWELYKNFNLIHLDGRFKVGEEVQLVWNQRSKYNWFNKNTGAEIKNPIFSSELIFHKKINMIEITEVFKIEMCKIVDGSFHVKDDIYGYWFRDNVKELALLDGFKSSEEMFQWFDERYNLSESKPFWVFR